MPLQIMRSAPFVMAICLPLGGRVTLHVDAAAGGGTWSITSLVATAGAFWVQTWAQQHLPATTTAMVLTMEPVFALLFSMTFLGERLSGRSASEGAGLISAGDCGDRASVTHNARQF